MTSAAEPRAGERVRSDASEFGSAPLVAVSACPASGGRAVLTE
jgi:hypothetical protein